MNKLLVVDGQPLLRWALCRLVDQVSPHTQVLEAAALDEAAQRLAEVPGVELLLVDLALLGEAGLAWLEGVRGAHPSLGVAVLSEGHATADVLRAVDLGAMGFLSKQLPMDELERALSLVMLGGVYLPTAPLDATAEAGRAASGPRGGFGAALPALLPAAAGISPALRYASLGLTPRQCEVLVLLLKGLPNKVIARDMSLSVETVKDHVAAVLKALGVASRTQAVLAVARLEQAAPRAECC